MPTPWPRWLHSPQVTHIEEDRLFAPALASSVPVIGADTAWANGRTGAGQAVAILDTGVDKTHDFFNGGKVVSEACYSTNGSGPHKWNQRLRLSWRR